MSNNRITEALQRADLEVLNPLLDMFPINDDYYYNFHSNYRWVKPLTEECANELNYVFLTELFYPDEDRFRVNRWTCINIAYDGFHDIISAESMMKDVKKRFSYLGIKVSFERGEQDV